MTPLTEPLSSSSSKKEELGQEIPQTPPRRKKWKCYKCNKEANEHSICSFCNRVCCQAHRRYTNCCHWWICEQCTCYCERPPPVSTAEQSAGGPPGDPPAESSLPEYSAEETSKEAQTMAEAQDVEGGSDVQAQPEAKADPPRWAKWLVKPTSKAPPSTICEVVQMMDDFDDSYSSTTTERTPERTSSPIRPDPQEEEVKPPPQPDLRVITFNSVEDMRENLVLEGKPLSPKQ